MKRIILIMLVMAVTLSSQAQFVFKDGKATAKMDSLVSNGNAVVFRNKLTGSMAYFRTSGDSLFFGDTNGEKYIGDSGSGAISGNLLKAVGGSLEPYANQVEAPTNGMFYNNGVAFNTDALKQYSGGKYIFKTNNKGYISNDHTSFNFAFGDSMALRSITSGYRNIAIGHLAMGLCTSGYNNTAIGSRPLYSVTSGSRNIAIGMDALYSITTSTGNVAVGCSTLYQNTAVGNTGVGDNVMVAGTTGDYNTAIGKGSMESKVGSYNTALGAFARGGEGSYNTSVGSYSLYTNGSNNIAIGYYSGAFSTSCANRLFINSLNRTNILGDSTKSIIYGRQSTNSDDQYLFLNVGKLFVKGGRNQIKLYTDTNGYIHNTAPHAFSKFMDSTITITLTQNTWYQVTRPVTKTTWPTSEFIGFTDSGDTITANFAGHYILKYQVNVQGVDSKVYEYRIMRDNFGATEEVWRYAVTGSGSIVLRDISTYIDLDAGSKFWIEVRSTSSAPGDITILGGQMRVYPIHLNL